MIYVFLVKPQENYPCRNLFGNNEIIHAFEKVRVDKLNKKGIINALTLEKTHNFQAIRRNF